ncbi:MAG: hypothetical protein J7M26_04060 [Armatimonadetes bacterium]|nr:hypothetical protein [Armatimonadota bacterium]
MLVIVMRPGLLTRWRGVGGSVGVRAIGTSEGGRGEELREGLEAQLRFQLIPSHHSSKSVG